MPIISRPRVAPKKAVRGYRRPHAMNARKTKKKKTTTKTKNTKRKKSKKLAAGGAVNDSSGDEAVETKRRNAKAERKLAQSLAKTKYSNVWDPERQKELEELQATRIEQALEYASSLREQRPEMYERLLKESKSEWEHQIKTGEYDRATCQALAILDQRHQERIDESEARKTAMFIEGPVVPDKDDDYNPNSDNGSDDDDDGDDGDDEAKDKDEDQNNDPPTSTKGHATESNGVDARDNMEESEAATNPHETGTETEANGTASADDADEAEEAMDVEEAEEAEEVDDDDGDGDESEMTYDEGILHFAREARLGPSRVFEEARSKLHAAVADIAADPHMKRCFSYPVDMAFQRTISEGIKTAVEAVLNTRISVSNANLVGFLALLGTENLGKTIARRQRQVFARFKGSMNLRVPPVPICQLTNTLLLEESVKIPVKVVEPGRRTSSDRNQEQNIFFTEENLGKFLDACTALRQCISVFHHRSGKLIKERRRAAIGIVAADTQKSMINYMEDMHVFGEGAIAHAPSDSRDTPRRVRKRATISREAKKLWDRTAQLKRDEKRHHVDSGRDSHSKRHRSRDRQKAGRSKRRRHM